MTAGSLRDRQRAQVRADIRRAAFRLFIERGYDAVTTEEIASAAGVSPRTYFRHVPTKEDLLLAPVRYGGTAIINLLQDRPDSESPDTALINAIVARTRSFDQDDTEEWREALLVAPELLHKLRFLTPPTGSGRPSWLPNAWAPTLKPTCGPACWSRSPSPQQISPFSGGYGSPPRPRGRSTTTSPKPSTRCAVTAGPSPKQPGGNRGVAEHFRGRREPREITATVVLGASSTATAALTA